MKRIAVYCGSASPADPRYIELAREVGDTLATRWTVTAKADKPKHKGGIIEMKGQATNQRKEIVVECEGKILVASVVS